MMDEAINALGAMGESIAIIYNTLVKNGVGESSAALLTTFAMRYIFVEPKPKTEEDSDS